MSVRFRRRKYNDEMRLLAIIGLLALAFSLWHPDAFATTNNLKNMARQGSVLLIVTIGQMLPLLVGGLDVSVGAIMGLTSVVASMTMVKFGLLPGLLVGLLVSTVLGAINGVVISRFRVSPFIVTLGMMSFARGLALQLAQGRSIIGLPRSFAWFGSRDYGIFPLPFVIAMIIVVFMAFLLYRTRAGLYFYAIGGNEEASRLAGLPLARYQTLAYTLSGTLAGIGGLVLTSRVFSGQPSLGAGFELTSIATAVIGGVSIGGGVGSLTGVGLGVVLMSILSTGMNIARVSTFTQSMFTGVVIVAAVVWDRFRASRAKE